MSATPNPRFQGFEAGATTRTRIRIEIDGAPMVVRLAACVSAVLVRQALGVPAAAEIDCIDPVAEDVRTVRPGLRLSIGIDRPGDLFEGSITGLERDHGADGSFRLRVRAYDALHVARRRCRVRSLERVSAGDLATQIAGEIGLAARIGEPGPTRELVLQRGESDLALLRRLAGATGLYPVVIGRELRLTALDGSGTDVPVRLGRELVSVRLGASSERALRRVEVLGWNTRDLAPCRSTVTTARQDLRELLDSGIETDDTLGVRFLLDRQVETDAEANGLGEAAMDAATASAVAATGTLTGDTRFVPGQGIRIEDLPGADPARLVLSEVIHRIDTAGDYRCTFSTQTPSTLDLAPDRPLLTRGRVVDVSDPEGAGRCRIAFDAIGDIRSGWLQIVVAGAGKDKGAVALPEVGDEVLALVSDGTLTQGFVLGGLYGQARLPRGLGKRGKRPLVLRTAAGQALQLDSEGATARLSTQTGNHLEFTAGRTRLASAADMVIEAPGRTLTIRADRIRFEQG